MIDRESIKAKISLAIKQLPTIGIVYREREDQYHSRVDLEEITTLEGLFYTEERSSLKDITISNTGQIPPKKRKTFLTVYNEESAKVQVDDLIKLEGNFFRIVDAGEDLQIYCSMELVKFDTGE